MDGSDVRAVGGTLLENLNQQEGRRHTSRSAEVVARARLDDGAAARHLGRLCSDAASHKHRDAVCLSSSQRLLELKKLISEARYLTDIHPLSLISTRPSSWSWQTGHLSLRQTMPPSLGPQPTAAVNEAIYEYLLATNDAQAPEHRALCSAPFLAEQTTRAREALYELSQLSSIGLSSRASYEAALRTLEALGEAVGMDATDEGYAFAYLALRSQVRPHTAADAHCALSALCSLLSALL